MLQTSTKYIVNKNWGHRKLSQLLVDQYVEKSDKTIA